MSPNLFLQGKRQKVAESSGSSTEKENFEQGLDHGQLQEIGQGQEKDYVCYSLKVSPSIPPPASPPAAVVAVCGTLPPPPPRVHLTWLTYTPEPIIPPHAP
jgi:hypothetical protein